MNKPLSVDDREKILSKLKGKRNQLIFHIGCNLGLRISEILSIDIDNFSKNKIVGETLKVKQLKARKVATRILPLNSKMRSLLQEYLNECRYVSGSLFREQTGNTQLSRFTYINIIKKAAKESGVTSNVSTHSMRKTFARAVYEQSGLNIVITQKALGHSNPANTALYLGIFEEQVNKQIEELVI